MTDEPDQIRLLLVEDSEDDAVLVVNRLRRSGLRIDYERVETADGMRDALRHRPPDIVISDNGMPSFDAEAALHLLRSTGQDIPFIVVSGQIGEESATALMRAGAHDFVLKDKLARLAPAVQRELRDAWDRQERRRTEAALRTSEERFRLVEVEAAEQRRELERQLHQAERLDSLGQLAGGVAHDFNNILGVISGYTGFVLDELGPDHPCRPDLENIEDAARRAAALTRQLLIFSRLQPSQPEVVDLNEVVGQIERLLRRTIGEDIEFGIDVEPGLDCVTIDPSRLEQIIMNLVVNARAAMPEGGRLDIRTASADRVPATAIGAPPSSERFVCLTVTDTGCGMDEEVQRRAFEPFFTTRGTGQGSGLGLATVYGAVHEAAGAITVDSAPGAGTRITVYLPAAARPVTAAAPDGTTGAPGRGSGERILVVEDDDDIRAISRRLLTRGGYTVADVATRDEALRLVQDDDLAFDLMLSDVIMPGMPVLEFVETVLRARPSIRIVFMSGYTADSDRRLPEGVPIVNKPFSRETLLHQIRTTLNSGSR
ncbi:response regulator [Actinoplanes xinjiangensis]|uniref:response regulator n=1 Tax=Actinoplanes xinjiangensis TaxID=512350 RepID=UPI003441B877